MKILIPAKSKSTRCPSKNYLLLIAAKLYLEKEHRVSDAVVICDDEDICNYANMLGLKTWMNHRPGLGDILAIRSYLEDCPLIDEFIWMPLTQPLRSKGLLNEIEYQLKRSHRNMVTTFQYVPDRSIFYINEDNTFEIDSVIRTGSMCPRKRMLDGALYAIKTKWFENVASNQKFWSEPFDTIINNAPFLDIDEPEDMKKLLELPYGAECIHSH